MAHAEDVEVCCLKRGVKGGRVMVETDLQGRSVCELMDEHTKYGEMGMSALGDDARGRSTHGGEFPESCTGQIKTKIQSAKDEVEPCIFVDFEPPHNIRSMNQSFLMEFGFKRSDLLGRTWRVIHGPRTDSQRIVHLMDKARCQHTAGSTEVLLYCKDARELQCRVSIDSATHHNKPVCALRMNRIETVDVPANCPVALPEEASCLKKRTVSILDAIQELEPEIIVGLEPPHRILTTNDGFLGLFRFRSADLTNCTLRIIQGPMTDARALTSLIAASPRADGDEAASGAALAGEEEFDDRGAAPAEPSAGAAAAAAGADTPAAGRKAKAAAAAAVLTLYRKDGEEAVCRVLAAPAAVEGAPACLLRLGQHGDLSGRVEVRFARTRPVLTKAGRARAGRQLRRLAAE